MAGRPPLRIGQHGKIARIDLGGGIWLARCRFRDDDGVVRIVERRSPSVGRDLYGKRAEDELLADLADRGGRSSDEVTAETKLAVLNALFLAALEAEGREIRTLDTYRSVSAHLNKALGGVRVREATTQRIDRALVALRKTSPTYARQARSILNGMFGIAIRAGAVDHNPVRDVSPIRRGKDDVKKPARAISADALSGLLRDLYASEVLVDGLKRPRSVAQYCDDVDLADVIVMFVATGLRRSELLAIRWVDVDLENRTVAVTGKVVRAAGRGLIREDTGKSASARRVISLPMFAVAMLERRRSEPHPSDHGVVFPSTSGSLRDPDNTNAQWRRVRDALGLDWVTSHSFRKTVATLIDDGGLSARVGADHLGHAKVSMTQDVYMARGRVHSSVADLLDAAISDE